MLRRCVLVSLAFPYLQLAAVVLMLRTASPVIDVSSSMALIICVSILLATLGANVFMDTMAGRDPRGVRPWMRCMMWCNGALGVATFAYALLRFQTVVA